MIIVYTINCYSILITRVQNQQRGVQGHHIKYQEPTAIEGLSGKKGRSAIWKISDLMVDIK